MSASKPLIDLSFKLIFGCNTPQIHHFEWLYATLVLSLLFYMGL